MDTRWIQDGYKMDTRWIQVEPRKMNARGSVKGRNDIRPIASKALLSPRCHVEDMLSIEGGPKRTNPSRFPRAKAAKKANSALCTEEERGRKMRRMTSEKSASLLL